MGGSPESRARESKRVAKPRGNGARATRNRLPGFRAFLSSPYAGVRTIFIG